MIYLIVFLVSFVSDMLWALYIKKVAESKILTAGVTSGLIVIASWVSGYFIVRDLTLVVIAGIGAFLGTVVVLRQKDSL